MKHTGYGIPFAVRVRAMVPHALIALVATAVYLLAVQFLIGGTVRSVAQWKRAEDSPTNEIVFSGAQNPGETCYYLKNHAVAGTTGENAVSDVFMVLPDVTYAQNSIYFSGTLEEGSCAVSANIAARFGLSVGDHARVIGTDKLFRVDRLLPAQEGLDADYLHEGIVVLAYDSELLNKDYWYVTFATDGDAYRDLYRLVYVADLKSGCAATLLLSACVAVAVIIAVMLLCETFLFRGRKEDYRVLVALGLRRRRLFCRILAENGLKYWLPAAITVAAHTRFYACYAAAYAMPAVYFMAICALICMIYSLIITRRLYYVKST